jgi:precorrin-6A synthase
MMTLALIGIGCGDSGQLTRAAISAINAADLVLIPRKGTVKSDLADLRRTICADVLTNGTTRLPPPGRRRSKVNSAARARSRC